MRLDGMNAVTIGADGREIVTPCDGLAVNALIEVCRDLGVALAAGGGDVEFGDWRLGVVRGADRVRAMAISTDGSLGEPFSVARPCTLSWYDEEGLRGFAASTPSGTSARGSAPGIRNIGVTHRGLRISAAMTS